MPKPSVTVSFTLKCVTGGSVPFLVPKCVSMRTDGTATFPALGLFNFGYMMYVFKSSTFKSEMISIDIVK